MVVPSSTKGHSHGNLNSCLWGELDFILMSSVPPKSSECCTTSLNYIPNYPVQYSAQYSFPILSASEMHLEWLSWKTQCPPQPMMACWILVPKAGSCLEARMWFRMLWEDQMESLASIPIPYLYEQVDSPAGASCWYWYTCQRHPLTLEEQCKSWEAEKAFFLLKFEEKPI